MSLRINWLSLLGEAIPNWISALTALGTLIAAVGAGFFAGLAAHWTRKQAEASALQVKIDQQALGVALGEAADARLDAEWQRLESEKSHRRLEESRFDSLAPVVYAVARRRGLMWRSRSTFAQDGTVHGWEPVNEEFTQDEDERADFISHVGVSLNNPSQRIARIDFVDLAGGSMSIEDGPDLARGEPIFLPPSATRKFSWRRVISSKLLLSDESIARPEVSRFDLTFTVSDLGLNVTDQYAFSASLAHFEWGLVQIHISPNPAQNWRENVAIPTTPRSYPRIV